jgi:hypothetical protein
MRPSVHARLPWTSTNDLGQQVTAPCG